MGKGLSTQQQSIIQTIVEHGVQCSDIKGVFNAGIRVEEIPKYERIGFVVSEKKGWTFNRDGAPVYEAQYTGSARDLIKSNLSMADVSAYASKVAEVTPGSGIYLIDENLLKAKLFPDLYWFKGEHYSGFGQKWETGAKHLKKNSARVSMHKSLNRLAERGKIARLHFKMEGYAYDASSVGNHTSAHNKIVYIP